MRDQPQLPLPDELLRRLGALVRSVQLYSSGHPLVTRNLESLLELIDLLHEAEREVVIGLVGDELIVANVPMTKASASMGEFIRRLHAAEIERIIISRGVTAEELMSLVQKLSSPERTEVGSDHIRVGRLTVGEKAESSDTGMGTIRHMYKDAVSVANTLWESARLDGRPDILSATSMIDDLAHSVSQNRRSLVALTALKEYDNYTFTHMVNVSILTMAQARGLGLDGPLLRELGLAALMHDIGKVHTPSEILTKPDRLTAEEFAIMKRHTVDGAQILRRTPDTPTLAPIVALEHHLRLDGTGYPEGISRDSLNLGTMLCGIADVFDAMRSKRSYQQAFPTARILAVLRGNDGKQFDQNLVRRFVQLIGIYPVGNLVRLDTGEIAVVVRVHAPNPYRPEVRVLFDNAGNRLALPFDIHLWETEASSGHASSVSAPVDPAEYPVDPLEFV